MSNTEATVKNQPVNGTIIESHSAFYGPIPPPETLTGYNQIEKGFANRILVMAEKEQEERLNNNRKLVESYNKTRARGQVFGFILGLLIISLAGWLGYLGHDFLAGTFVTSALIIVLAIFVLNKEPNTKDKE